MNILTLDQKKAIFQKYISSIDLKSIEAEKHMINFLTNSFNKKEGKFILYYDSFTKEQISYEEYERRYYRFVLLNPKT